MPKLKEHISGLKKKYSLRNKVVFMLVAAAVIIGVCSTTISFIIYKNTMDDRYTDISIVAVSMMANEIDANKIESYMDDSGKSTDYVDCKNRLIELKSCMSDIEYMYVYRIMEDGCHVVFDLDTPDLPGEDVGTVVPFDSSFLEYVPDLLAGNEIKPIVSNDSYGWLMTVYKPLYNDEGKCVAYAAVDISMEDVVTDRYVFIIRITSLLFGATIIITLFGVWLAERQIIEPINRMAKATGDFAYESETNRHRSTKMIQSLKINTGDEIENLYGAIAKTVTDLVQYINENDEKARIIYQMQRNVIVAFANMVENRDENTGKHVKHTAAYVKAIAESLKRNGKYANILTDDYIDAMVQSAPLHDIGKIKIPDAILNKPGKLTPEEFDVIKTHTTAGRDILNNAMKGIENTDYLHEAMDMAEYHHEKWNGQGYPKGMKMDEIPLGARIMAVSDVFDALISKRSYKDAFAVDRAVDIIKDEAGKHFDPDVVEAFLDALDEIKSQI